MLQRLEMLFSPVILPFHVQSHRGGFISCSVINFDLIFKAVLALLDAPEKDWSWGLNIGRGTKTSLTVQCHFCTSWAVLAGMSHMGSVPVMDLHHCITPTFSRYPLKAETTISAKPNVLGWLHGLVSPLFSQICFLPDLSQSGTPRNPASPAACLQKRSIADVKEKVGWWSKKTVMLPQNVSNPPLGCISPRGKSFCV